MVGQIQATLEAVEQPNIFPCLPINPLQPDRIKMVENEKTGSIG